MSKRSAVAVLAIAGLMTAAATAPAAGGPPAAPAAPQEEPAPPPAREPLFPAVETERFSLRISPWVNLHHFLYQWARVDAEPGPRDTRPPVVVLERRDWEGLPPEVRGGWAAAAMHYREDLVGRSLTFDDGLIAIRTALGAAVSWDPALLREVPAPVAGALRQAAPLYRQRWWRAHAVAGRAWIDSVVPLLREHGEFLQRGMVRACGGEWPARRVPVEVTYYANWAGAYTTDDPMVITISSGDPDIREGGALELMFHEASHTDSMAGRLRRDLDAAFARNGGEPPRRLWHTMIFHTAGSLTRSALEGAGVGYEPYAVRVGLVERAPGWTRTWKALERHWRPYLDGKVERDVALDRLAADLLRDAGEE